MAPAANRSRSVRVVLPASTWARTPRLSVCMEPHVVRVGADELPAGHDGFHDAPFSRLRRGCAAYAAAMPTMPRPSTGRVDVARMAEAAGPELRRDRVLVGPPQDPVRDQPGGAGTR